MLSSLVYAAHQFALNHQFFKVRVKLHTTSAIGNNEVSNEISCCVNPKIGSDKRQFSSHGIFSSMYNYGTIEVGKYNSAHVLHLE
jgi:hypothetical protein